MYGPDDLEGSLPEHVLPRAIVPREFDRAVQLEDREPVGGRQQVDADERRRNSLRRRECWTSAP